MILNLFMANQGVDNWGHIGGLIFGALYTIAFYPAALDTNHKLSTKLRLLSKITLACILLGMIVTVVMIPLKHC